MKFMKTQDKNTQISVYCTQHYYKQSFGIIKQLLPALAVNIIASCYRFSCYYRFSDIAINSVSPSFIGRMEFSKNDQLNISLYIRLFSKPFLYFNILSIIWQLLLSVKWRHLISCEVITRPIYGMETNIKSGNGWF